MVVAPSVAIGEERFAGVLRSGQSSLHVVAILEAVSEPVLVFIAEISVAVAFALV